MTRIVERSRQLLTEHGSGAFGFYTTGQLFIEDYYTLAVLAHGGIGTNHLDGNTRLCTATAAQALKETFGSDGQPGSYADVEHCDTLFHVGINAAETQTVLWMRQLDRLHGPDRPRLVVVDPRPTQAAKEADVHLAIRNGTNVAILNAILNQLIENDWLDREFVDLHTIGFDALEKVVSQYSPGTPPRSAVSTSARSDRLRRSSGAPSACLVRPARRLPVAPGDGGGMSGQQREPPPRDDRKARLWRLPDERPANCAEHARNGMQRRSPRVPQLAERRAGR